MLNKSIYKIYLKNIQILLDNDRLIVYIISVKKKAAKRRGGKKMEKKIEIGDTVRMKEVVNNLDAEPMTVIDTIGNIDSKIVVCEDSNGFKYNLMRNALTHY